MKDKKRFLALVLSALLLVPAPAAYASELSGEGQAAGVSGGNQEEEALSEEQEEEGTFRRQADLSPSDAQGFTIEERVVEEVEERVLTAYTGAGGEITIPETVTMIDKNVFEGNDSLTKVICPEGLKKIGSNAFRGCTSLTEIHFNESLTHIDYSAFQNCTSLKEVNFPGSIIMIGGDAFSDCSALEDIGFEPRKEEISSCWVEGSFRNCTSLKEVTVPFGIEIKGGAFRGCTSLNEFKVSEGSFYSVFDGCLYDKEQTRLIVFPGGKTEVEFPETITEIGGNAFAKSPLVSVEIPDTVTEIGGAAFDGCENLERCILPKNLTTINSYTFRSCGLKKIDIPETVDNISSQAFAWCGELRTVTIPGSVQRIDQEAFESCIKLESIYIQEGVMMLEQRCLRNCPSLVTIAIPESVRSISYEVGIGWVDDTSSYDKKKVTIYGKAGSEAEKYAKENGVNFSTEEPPAPPVVVDPGYDISGDRFTVTLEQDVYTYDGKAKRPVATVKKGEEELLRGTDFMVRYENNINPGTAKAIITGDGEYSGTVEKMFTIQGKDISGTGFTVTLSETTFTYDGKEKTPAVTVMEGANKLRGTDFTVKYENNVNPGTAKAIVTGTGFYAGTVTKEFTIKKNEKKSSLGLSCKKVFEKKYGDKAFSLKASVKNGGKITYKSSDKKVVTVDKKGKVTIKGTGIATITLTAQAAGYDTETLKVTVKVSPAKPSAPSLKTMNGRKLKVSWKKDKYATGYQVQYCTSKNFKKGVKSFNIGKNKTISKTIPKLAKGKRYYVRVRSYKSVKLNKKTQKLYSSWSSVKRSGKIKK